jgi:hypothetical protein
MIQKTLDKMRFEHLKRDRMLDITKTMIEAWAHHRENGVYIAGDEMDLNVKAVIQEQAQLEWGDGTKAHFNDLTLEVLVINSDGRESTISIKKTGT